MVMKLMLNVSRRKCNMSHGKYAKCPCCGKLALGENKIIELFGYRLRPNGKIVPQSYCRECRSEQVRLRNKLKKEKQDRRKKK